MGKRDAEAMDGLTDEERKAIEEADAEESGGKDAAKAGTDAVEGEQDDKRAEQPRDPETGKFVKKDEAVGDDPLKAQAEAGDADADEPETDDGGEEDEMPAPRRRIETVKAPDDADARLAEIAKRRDELAEQFDNGDITAKEFQAEIAKLDDERLEIKMALNRAEMVEELRKDTWLNQTVPAWLSRHAVYGENETLHGMLDLEVRKLQVKAMEDGGDPFDPAILDRAHKSLTAAIHVLTGAPLAKPNEKPAAKPAAKRPPAPPTLAAIPSADITDTDGEFAALDRLASSDPIAFEDAMAKLSEAQRERYLRAH